MPDEIKDALRELERAVQKQQIWAAEHDGRINQLWNDQTDFNKRMKVSVDFAITEALSVKQRLNVYGAVMASFGSFVGVLAGLAAVAMFFKP